MAGCRGRVGVRSGLEREYGRFCGSGKWLIRSVDVRGQVDRAGFLSRPAVPSRARLIVEFLPSGVGDELSVDDVGESSFEATQGFHGGLLRVEFASVVGAAFGVVTELDDGGDVQDVVHPPVPCPRESVPYLLSGGGVQWCGAG